MNVVLLALIPGYVPFAIYVVDLPFPRFTFGVDLPLVGYVLRLLNSPRALLLLVVL